MVGSVTHEEHCAAREEAVRLCKSNECSKLLVDLRELCTDRSSTLSCFLFGESLAKEPQYLCIAHVLPKDPTSAKDIKFTSTVEANRGKSTREFESIAEAERWLLEQR